MRQRLFPFLFLGLTFPLAGLTLLLALTFGGFPHLLGGLPLRFPLFCGDFAFPFSRFAFGLAFLCSGLTLLLSRLALSLAFLFGGLALSFAFPFSGLSVPLPRFAFGFCGGSLGFASTFGRLGQKEPAAKECYKKKRQGKTFSIFMTRWTREPSSRFRRFCLLPMIF